MHVKLILLLFLILHAAMHAALGQTKLNYETTANSDNEDYQKLS